MTFKNIFTKVINLEHRTDRRLSAESQLNLIGVDTDNVFFPAFYVEKNGALGCAMSHAMALISFIFVSDCEYAIIFEDDFEIKEPALFLHNIEKIKDYLNLWDVYLIGHKWASPVDSTPLIGVNRVTNVQTATAYMVSRHYAPKLIQCFLSSIVHLQKSVLLQAPYPYYLNRNFAIDINWKALQVVDRFWANDIPLVHQRESYSDIEKKFVNYEA